MNPSRALAATAVTAALALALPACGGSSSRTQEPNRPASSATSTTGPGSLNGDPSVPSLDPSQSAAQTASDSANLAAAAAAEQAASSFLTTLQNYPGYPTPKGWRQAVTAAVTPEFAARFGSGLEVDQNLDRVARAHQLTFKVVSSCYPNGWVLLPTKVSLNCSYTVHTVGVAGAEVDDQATLSSLTTEAGEDWPSPSATEQVSYMLLNTAGRWLVDGPGTRS